MCGTQSKNELRKAIAETTVARETHNVRAIAVTLAGPAVALATVLTKAR